MAARRHRHILDPNQMPLGFESTSSEPPWPAADRFPYNYRPQTVGDVVLPDLVAVPDPLIVTSFTSIDYLIARLPMLAEKSDGNVRIVLGHDPHATKRADFRGDHTTFSQAVVDYWVTNGISVTLSCDALRVIRLLEAQKVRVRISPSMHSKIYATSDAVTLGSSNFSISGLHGQIEFNARFLATSEPERYREARDGAENHWRVASDYQAGILALLRRLLLPVTWEEALARACAALLEGAWMRAYLKAHGIDDQRTLWPSQQQGVAQALWMLENVGSVLVADATGSGKTRMGARLLRALINRLASTGRLRVFSPVLISPPREVKESWMDETECAGLQIASHSHGVLSHKGSRKHERLNVVLRQTQILAIDEAHNFLNLRSRRTRQLLGNLAEYIVLFTATPINRGPRDLLKIIDLLGADNLDAEALDVFQRLTRVKSVHHELSEEEREAIRRELRRFTVRRTKSELNTMIDAAPDRYTDDRGRRCRYPENIVQKYPCQGDSRANEAASMIEKITTELRGLVRLRSRIELPAALRTRCTDEMYLKQRLLAARGLARHTILSAMRSSRAALIEHVYGTARARQILEMPDTFKPDLTGNMIGELSRIESPPEIGLNCDIPSWLSDLDAYRDELQREISRYEEIGRIAREMLGESRERDKCAAITRAFEEHQRLLVFDRHPITLFRIRAMLSQELRKHAQVATSGRPSDRRKLLAALHPSSSVEKCIGLCSDNMSEGVNLQRASAVLMLDVPSVPRLAEQRIGRIERMNSPHRIIESWWPDDGVPFRLRQDELLYARLRWSRDLIGSDLRLPETEGSTDNLAQTSIAVDDYLKRLGHDPSDTMVSDAFDPIRQLVSGNNALVPPDTYQRFAHSEAQIRTSISLLRSSRAWAFLALQDSRRAHSHDGPSTMPIWVYFDGPEAAPITDLERICTGLRTRLCKDMPSAEFDSDADVLIRAFMQRIAMCQRELLPRKKQRAIDQMLQTLEHYVDGDRRGSISIEVQALALELLNTCRGGESGAMSEVVDLHVLADAWLRIIQPRWREAIQAHNRSRPLLLQDLSAGLLSSPLSPSELREIKAQIVWVPPVDRRIVAIIIGVPRHAADAPLLNRTQGDVAGPPTLA